MKKVFPAVILSLFSVNVFAAAGTDADFAINLNGLAVAAAENIRVDRTAPPAPAKAEISKTGSSVRVSGYVYLHGFGWVPGPGGGFTTITVSGYAAFRDSTGKITSNNTYISDTVSLWIYPNQYASRTVWPNVRVQFYRDGKAVGSANMSGSINVGGWPSGGSVDLTGSGYLNGSVFVEDAP
ncbi:MAG: hypothetical protein WCW52_09290 [Elusimicrobiales bacterium]|jgi:hypothetical protein